MSEENKNLSEDRALTEDLNLEDFNLNPVSSGSLVKKAGSADQSTTAESEPSAAAEIETDTNEDPVFKLLSEPKLPELPKENRARLQMQSPNRIYFYWSLQNNPYQILNRVFRNQTDSYRLVVKLINQTRDAEEIHPVEPAGNWWFDVDADSVYRAEIGFYAPNRPYFRILFSNTLATPRKSPSVQRDYSPEFSIDAQNFAEMLKRAGYAQDAFEVALAGDDVDYADYATQKAFTDLAGEDVFAGENASELRFALLALASGYSLEDLRGQIGNRLFELLEKYLGGLSAEKAFQSLRENFDLREEEFFEEQELLEPTALGASFIHFPKVSRKRTRPKKVLPKIEPISSFRV